MRTKKQVGWQILEHMMSCKQRQFVNRTPITYFYQVSPHLFWSNPLRELFSSL